MTRINETFVKSLIVISAVIGVFALIGACSGDPTPPSTAAQQEEPKAPWDGQPAPASTPPIINTPTDDQPRDPNPAPTSTTTDEKTCQLGVYNQQGDTWDEGCNTKQFQAREIIRLDNCRVYRFFDAGMWHYYQDCTGR